MNIAKARQLIAHDKAYFGRLLNSYKRLNEQRKETAEAIKACQRDTERLYKMFPELRPEKVKQLNFLSIWAHTELESPSTHSIRTCGA